jgi:hypothetical protein
MFLVCMSQDLEIVGPHLAMFKALTVLLTALSLATAGGEKEVTRRDLIMGKGDRKEAT